jgi:hypothetical protein
MRRTSVAVTVGSAKAGVSRSVQPAGTSVAVVRTHATLVQFGRVAVLHGQKLAQTNVWGSRNGAGSLCNHLTPESGLPAAVSCLKSVPRRQTGGARLGGRALRRRRSWRRLARAARPLPPPPTARQAEALAPPTTS